MKVGEENFVQFAMNIREAPVFDISEFTSDLARVKYLSKLFTRYSEKNDLQVRLILNHVTVLYNVFGPPAECTKMLVFKLKNFLPQLKTVLLHFGYWQDVIMDVEGLPIIYTEKVPIDEILKYAIDRETSKY